MAEKHPYMLLYDDDGDELRPGDKVRINMDEIRMIIEVNGRNVLENWPDDEVIYNLELVWPPNRPGRDEDEENEWPDNLKD